MSSDRVVFKSGMYFLLVENTGCLKSKVLKVFDSSAQKCYRSEKNLSLNIFLHWNQIPRT